MLLSKTKRRRQLLSNDHETVLFFPSTQRDGGAEVFFCGGDASAAFADEFGVVDQMGVSAGVVFVQTRTV